jgi:putative transposase
MATNPIPLEFGKFYHIFNRGNNRENIFRQERNYSYFMELWWKHTFQIADSYAFCLLRNHFHAAVYIKEEQVLKEIKNLKEPSQYFANFFNAYSRGVNIATQRIGALFERPFERIEVMDNDYLLRLIVYIHQNPQKHKFTEEFRDWPYSSYHALIGNGITRLKRDKALELFGGRDAFLRIHQDIQPLVDLEDS